MELIHRSSTVPPRVSVKEQPHTKSFEKAPVTRPQSQAPSQNNHLDNVVCVLSRLESAPEVTDHLWGCSPVYPREDQARRSRNETINSTTERDAGIHEVSIVMILAKNSQRCTADSRASRTPKKIHTEHSSTAL